MSKRGVVVFALLLAGCGSSEPAGPSAPSSVESAPAPVASSAAPIDDSKFHHGVVNVRPGTVPARYTAALPSLVGVDNWPAEGPPTAHLRDGLCFGDAHLREVYLSSLELAASQAKTLEALEPYADLVKHCNEPSRCAWAAEVVTSSKPLAVRQTVWWALVRCESEKAEALFDRQDVPPEVLAEHVSGLRWGRPSTPRPRPRLISGAKDLEASDPRKLGRFLYTLATSDEASKKFVLQRFAELPKGEIKWAYGAAACRIGGDEAKRACETACKTRKSDRSCKHDPPEVEVWPADLVAYACSDRGSFSSLLRQNPDRAPEVSRAIAQCLGEDRVAPLLKNERSVDGVGSLLQELASLDYAAAREVAKQLKARLPAGSKYALVRDLAFLERFATPADASLELHKLGFVLPTSTGEGQLSLAGVLATGGVFTHFDPETDQWPNEHDHLARELAHPLGKELEGVVFEEVPPSEDDKPYTLRAYVDGKILELEAQNLGDWYDIDAVVGLVNAALRRRQASGRVALTQVGGNDGEAVSGPIAGLLALQQQGELTLLAAANDGVRKAIENEGKMLRDMGAQPMPGQGFDGVKPK